MNSLATTARRPGSRTGRAAGWPIPAGLIALSIIPLSAGTLRLIQLAGDLAKGAGWAINLAVAEWIIRRASTAPLDAGRQAASPPQPKRATS